MMHEYQNFAFCGVFSALLENVMSEPDTYIGLNMDAHRTKECQDAQLESHSKDLLVKVKVKTEPDLDEHQAVLVPKESTFPLLQCHHHEELLEKVKTEPGAFVNADVQETKSCQDVQLCPREEREQGDTARHLDEGLHDVTEVSEDATNTDGRVNMEYPSIWTEKQYLHFKIANPWLGMSGEYLGCNTCSEVKSQGLGVFKTKGMSLSPEWTSATVTYSKAGDHQYHISCLRSKIYKHSTSKCHLHEEKNNYI
uniref:Uncharacterized protein n=1 Tax=Eptatretus burgeri TaxID=7764 RepID=A0A8C4N4E3_EPTBU